jgi:hypothetical protein
MLLSQPKQLHSANHRMGPHQGAPIHSFGSA